MPRTGTPSCSTLGSHTGASLSYTELGPPDKTIPTGSSPRISSSLAVQGKIAENTCCSRIRRAISCVYCPPKSSTTIPCRVLTVTPPLSRVAIVFAPLIVYRSRDEEPTAAHHSHAHASNSLLAERIQQH